MPSPDQHHLSQLPQTIRVLVESILIHYANTRFGHTTTADNTSSPTHTVRFGGTVLVGKVGESFRYGGPGQGEECAFSKDRLVVGKGKTLPEVLHSLMAFREQMDKELAKDLWLVQAFPAEFPLVASFDMIDARDVGRVWKYGTAEVRLSMHLGRLNIGSGTIAPWLFEANLADFFAEVARKRPVEDPMKAHERATKTAQGLIDEVFKAEGLRLERVVVCWPTLKAVVSRKIDPSQS